MIDDNLKAKIGAKYQELNERIKSLVAAGFSIENWVEACDVLFQGARVAEVAKEPDISVLPFYRNGLEYLTHAPKQVDLDQVLSSFDDSSDFYSYTEQLQIAAPFEQFMDRLECWAEALDLEMGTNWRGRTNVGRWCVPNPEDYDADDFKPPYYAWILVNINKLRKYFEPPVGPYETELNNNMYSMRLFSFRQSRDGWCFRPEIVETLRREMSEIPEENPLVGKYINWGAETVEDIPSWCLKVNDDRICKEVFEMNLGVKAVNSKHLFDTLNGNVANYFAVQERRFREILDESSYGVLYSDKSPTAALLDRLTEILGGLSKRNLTHGLHEFKDLLAFGLQLPRYEMFYFDWGWRYPEEGPDEPGYSYVLQDGSRQEVWCDTKNSKWHDEMNDVEDLIERIIEQGKVLAGKSELKEVENEWLDIETNWRSCKKEGVFYHSFGDIPRFSESLCRGITKMIVLLPHVCDIEDSSEDKCNSSTNDDGIIGKAYRDFIVECNDIERVVKLKVPVRNGQFDIRTYTIKNDMAWDVVLQFVKADSSPVKIKNPRRDDYNGNRPKLDIKKMFARVADSEDNRDEFYKHIYCTGRGCNATYELRAQPKT